MGLKKHWRGAVNTVLIAIALVVDSLLCLGFAWLAFSKGVRISETMDNAVGLLVLVSAVLLPILGFVSLGGGRGTASYRVLLFPAFLMSLAPAVIIPCAFLVALLVRPA